jgi:nucleoside-diphosphate-sugar epimerase
MRIAVTGATGSVGTAVLRRLVGSHEVIGIVRRPPAAHGVYGPVRWHGLDLAESTARAQLREIVAGCDAVVHLAWAFQPTRRTTYLARVGVGGTSAVLEAAHEAAVGHLVHMSSSATYAGGRYGERVDESWFTTGIPSCAYSRNKAAAEARLDEYEREYGAAGLPIARLRPGAIVQRNAASELMRYALPAYVPRQAISCLPFLPVDRQLCLPLVHADDVADAVLAVLQRRATGAFNLAAEPPLRRDDVAETLGALALHVPAEVIGTLAELTWRLRLQPVDRGWVDMAFSVPLLDCSRAHDELGWRPTWSAVEAFADTVAGTRRESYAPSPPLRRRSVVNQLYRDLVSSGLTTRRLP